MQVYCVKCKSKQKIESYEEFVMKNGRNAIKGKCPACNSCIFKIVSTKK